MLTFDKTGFTIRIETRTCPAEDWLALHDELLNILSLLDMEQNAMATPIHTLNLLSAMLPDWQTAKQMTPKQENVGQ